MTAKIYILLPVHNRREVTRKFIESLKAQTFSSYHLILIDDGSTDSTADMVLSLIPDATVLRGVGNWWWAGSLQQGINWLCTQELAVDTAVLFINDDSVMPEDFLVKGIAMLSELPNAMLQATVLDTHTGKTLDVGMVFDATNLQFRPPAAGENINCLTTNGLFVSWGNLVRVGGFHPRILPHYLSDYEFTIRAGRKGIALKVLPQLSLSWNQQTTGLRACPQDSALSFLKAYFSNRFAANPFHWTSFILLVSSWYDIPRHVFRVWEGAFKAIISKLIEIKRADSVSRDPQEK